MVRGALSEDHLLQLEVVTGTLNCIMEEYKNQQNIASLPRPSLLRDLNHIKHIPYTRSDETFTCFNCGIPNFSSGLFDTVFGDSIANQVANNSHGPSESSIWSSDIPESTRSSTSCNTSNLSSISNASVYDSSLLEDDGRQPLRSSPTKKNPQKLNPCNVKLAFRVS